MPALHLPSPFRPAVASARASARVVLATVLSTFHATGVATATALATVLATGLLGLQPAWAHSVPVPPPPPPALLVAPANPLPDGRSAAGAPPVLYGAELELPDTLGVGRVSSDVMRELPALEALTDYLNRRAPELGYARVLPVLARNQEEMSEYLWRGIVDVVSAEPIEAIRQVEEAGATVLLRERRQGRAAYHSVVVVRKDSPLASLRDLADKRLALQSGGSGGDFLMPLALLRDFGLRASRVGGPSGKPPPGDAAYFLLPTSSSVVRGVTRGLADAGSLTSDEWSIERRGDDTGGLRVLHAFGDVPRALVVVTPAMSLPQREALRSALLALQGEPVGEAVMAQYGGVTGFDVPDDDLLRQVEHLKQLYALVRWEAP